MTEASIIATYKGFDGTYHQFIPHYASQNNGFQPFYDSFTNKEHFERWLNGEMLFNYQPSKKWESDFYSKHLYFHLTNSKSKWQFYNCSPLIATIEKKGFIEKYNSYIGLYENISSNLDYSKTNGDIFIENIIQSIRTKLNLHPKFHLFENRITINLLKISNDVSIDFNEKIILKKIIMNKTKNIFIHDPIYSCLIGPVSKFDNLGIVLSKQCFYFDMKFLLKNIFCDNFTQRDYLILKENFKFESIDLSLDTLSNSINKIKGSQINKANQQAPELESKLIEKPQVSSTLNHDTEKLKLEHERLQTKYKLQLQLVERSQEKLDQDIKDTCQLIKEKNLVEQQYNTLKLNVDQLNQKHEQLFSEIMNLENREISLNNSISHLENREISLIDSISHLQNKFEAWKAKQDLLESLIDPLEARAYQSMEFLEKEVKQLRELFLLAAPKEITSLSLNLSTPNLKELTDYQLDEEFDRLSEQVETFDLLCTYLNTVKIIQTYNENEVRYWQNLMIWLGHGNTVFTTEADASWLTPESLYKSKFTSTEKTELYTLSNLIEFAQQNPDFLFSLWILSANRAPIQNWLKPLSRALANKTPLVIQEQRFIVPENIKICLLLDGDPYAATVSEDCQEFLDRLDLKGFPELKPSFFIPFSALQQLT